MAMAVLSVVLFSCVREEMTCDKELIVVQRIGEGGYVYTRGTVISSNTDLKEETFGLYGSLLSQFSIGRVATPESIAAFATAGAMRTIKRGSNGRGMIYSGPKVAPSPP